MGAKDTHAQRARIFSAFTALMHHTDGGPRIVVIAAKPATASVRLDAVWTIFEFHTGCKVRIMWRKNSVFVVRWRIDPCQIGRRGQGLITYPGLQQPQLLTPATAKSRDLHPLTTDTRNLEAILRRRRSSGHYDTAVSPA